jgi:hypothetical protein
MWWRPGTESWYNGEKGYFMAAAIEAKGNAFLTKCKGIAVVITAVGGLVIGLLSYFKESKDPRVKVSYEELSKSINDLSRDFKALSDAARLQQQQIADIQNFLLYHRDHAPAAAAAAAKRLIKPRTSAIPKAAPRALKKWDSIAEQHSVQTLMP